MITAIGTIGNSYVVKHGDKFYFKDASVLWMKSINRADSRYVNYWIESPDFKSQLEPNGTTVDTLTIGKLQSLRIDLPDIDTQQDVVMKLDNALAKTGKLEKQYGRKLSKLTDLRQSLLQEAFLK